MSNPIIADNKPKKVTLEEGKKYMFCVCGRSSGQPFCDGSHAGTGFTPKRYEAEENGQAFLCQCKHTSDAPFCDGTHARFENDQVGTEGPG
ncbi:CDGSH iron-sulfur domain-containing protein [Marinobacter sp.]|uniref:CDGSH iron-sulfur domain-containing protein n=1 Tax=Marinobacter sp. TaxID=50741 RepID=UPI002B45ECC8|nr:CDGSH iron-sulfur domain-containing protein [Marinobacter sp.]HKK57455.1 CDGSH iron-sulfur domain-containing protein [Marinobacter sp.]